MSTAKSKSKGLIIYSIIKEISILAVIIGLTILVFYGLDQYFPYIDSTTYGCKDYYIDKDNVYHLLVNSKDNTVYLEVTCKNIKSNAIINLADNPIDAGFHGEYNKEKSTFCYRSKEYKCKELSQSDLELFYQNIEEKETN